MPYQLDFASVLCRDCGQPSVHHHTVEELADALDVTVAGLRTLAAGRVLLLCEGGTAVSCAAAAALASRLAHGGRRFTDDSDDLRNGHGC